jgi:hypothetical protein
MKKIVIGISAFVCLIACSVTYYHHNEDKAAKSAIEFAQVAFVQHDNQKGYSLLPDFVQKESSLEAYSKFISRMHPSLYPLSLNALEYEPMAGPDIDKVNIFLYGENGSEKFYYRLLMKGTAEKGYEVWGFFRRGDPYPPSNSRQKLKNWYSTKKWT